MALVERQRLVTGRNYIETLILTLTQLEFTAGLDMDSKLAVILRLEEELCALSMSHRILRNTYHSALLELIREEYPNLPPPEFKSCFASRALREWIDMHSSVIFGGSIHFGSAATLREGEKALLARLLRTAIMATFYSAGIISLTT